MVGDMYKHKEYGFTHSGPPAALKQKFSKLVEVSKSSLQSQIRLMFVAVRTSPPDAGGTGSSAHDSKVSWSRFVLRENYAPAISARHTVQSTKWTTSVQ